jgi:hypothetical protein
MIKIIPDLPSNVIGFEVSGNVTAEDYETVLMPAVEAASSRDRKLRLLYHIGPGFEKFELGAMWDDAKVGLQHYSSWYKIAVVSDAGWIRTSIKVFGFAFPGHVRTFSNAEMNEAIGWLTK